jgi:hypothetical protein
MGFDLARNRDHSLCTGHRAYRVGLALPPLGKPSGYASRRRENRPKASLRTLILRQRRIGDIAFAETGDQPASYD